VTGSDGAGDSARDSAKDGAGASGTRAGSRGPGWTARLRTRVVEIGWLTAVWVLLWGTFTPLSIVGGVVVAVAVMASFRFPPAAAHLPVRPLRLLGLVAYLVYDMAASAVEVSRQTLRYGRAARGAVIVVPLLSSSDRVVTVIANALSLSPGAMALQIDHEHGLWFVYELGPRDQAGVERSRRRAMDMQRRVLAALGTPEELAAAQRHLEEGRA
jgi:multicomponent Na+:H+ antiporter subunit E